MFLSLFILAPLTVILSRVILALIRDYLIVLKTMAISEGKFWHYSIADYLV